MTHIAVWTVLRLIFILYLHTGECNHRCFSCDNLPLPRLCQTVVTCQHQTEVCYVERVNAGGHMLYNSGCTPQICLGSGGVSLVGKRSSNRLPRAANDTCMECCTDDYCNLNGCGMIASPLNLISLDTKQWTPIVVTVKDYRLYQQAIVDDAVSYNYTRGQKVLHDIPPTMRGPHCFECNVFMSPSVCNNIRTCMRDEACVMQEHPALMGASDVNYQSRCMKQTECAANVATAVFATSPCPPVCCAGDFCNTRCRHYPAVARTTTPIPPYAAIVAKSCRDKIFDGYLYDSFINLCASVRRVTHPVTQAEAASACAADNANLITIDSAKKMDFLLGMIFSHKQNDTDFWIGATSDVNNSHVFHWPDGSPITYNHFGGKMMAQPDDRRLHNEDCVFINNKDMYRWHDAQCESKKTGYICEEGHTSTHDKASVCHSLVYNGFFYDQHSDFCVTLVQVPAPGITHTAAVAECKKFGTNLVTIDNQDRTDFILSWIFSNRENATDFWIGAYDKHNNSDFYWPSGAKVTYANWGGPDYSDNPDIPDIPRTQPDAPRVHNERCVYMSYIYNYYWFDEACSQRKKGYMCELTGKDATEKENKCRQHLFAGYYYDHYTDMCVLLEPNGGIHGIDRHGALSKCQRVGARLIVIDTQRKMDFVLYQIFSHRANDTDFWIDAQDINGDGTFYWSTNQSVTWSHWYQAPTENCAYADYIDRYNWYPASCNAKKPGYVCEINKYTLSVHDCRDIYESGFHTTGVYNVSVNVSGQLQSLQVYCDMDSPGGGWTVFQRRFDGSVDFYRNFSEYESGFGDINGELWLGLKWVYWMTVNRTSQMIINMTEAATGRESYVKYGTFSLGPRTAYMLNLTSPAGTAAGIGLSSIQHNGQDFSTYDHDSTPANCAIWRHAGFWFNACNAVNLNGHYGGDYTGFYWQPGSQLRTSQMAFRRLS